MRKIYILIELLKAPHALVQEKCLTSIRTQCIQRSGSSISAANEVTLPEGAATLRNAVLWGQDY